MLPNSGRPVDLFRPDGEESRHPCLLTSCLFSYPPCPVSLEMQRKLSHLAVFACALLPRETQPPQLAAEVDAFITDDYDGRPTIPLPALRKAILAGAGGAPDAHCWRENQGIPAYKFLPGDLGHLPNGGSMGTDFVKLCNILDEGLVQPEELELVRDARGTQWDWDDPVGMRRQELPKYDLPGGGACWPVGVLPGQQIDCQVEHTTRVKRVRDGWKVLLEHGRALGERYRVPPEELILSAYLLAIHLPRAEA